MDNGNNGNNGNRQAERVFKEAMGSPEMEDVISEALDGMSIHWANICRAAVKHLGPTDAALLLGRTASFVQKLMLDDAFWACKEAMRRGEGRVITVKAGSKDKN